ncbi:macro domain-containing protein [Hyphomonas sp. ND6WE1B]|uniref:macro domain-containing protein n=1 Tax=Hyphomonas sp. ND6WE1B TaxID=1848191 RepID=UPI001111BF44|nr:macro domain-containing protein [Hyphomonas sp. ND6WE1B]
MAFAAFHDGLRLQIDRHFCIIAALAAFIAVLAGLARILATTEINFKAGRGGLQIHIGIGDIFKQPNSVAAIPMNDFFDAELETIIAPDTVHGIFLDKMFRGDRDAARSTIDLALQNQSISATEQETVARKIGATKRFPIGATCLLSTDRSKFILLSLSKTDAATNQVSTSIPDFVTALSGLWKGARSLASHQEISVPLMGTGTSRTQLEYEDALDFILLTAIREHNREPFTRRLNIVLRPEHLSRIDLVSLKRRYKHDV